MLIYIINFLSIPIWKVLVKSRKLFTAILSLQLFLILALRDVTIGSDLVTYSGGFSYISSLSLSSVLSRLRLINAAKLVSPYSFESGYVLLNKLVSMFGGNFRVFMILHAAFCVGSFGYFIYKHSSNPHLSFAMLAALGFYEYAFGILRQTLAVCILLWAVPFIWKKNPISYYLIVFVAFTIHRASAIFVLLYPISQMKITEKTFSLSFVFWLVLLILVKPIFNYILVPVLRLIGKGSHANGSMTFNFQIIIMILWAVLVALFADLKTLNGSEFKVNAKLNGEIAVKRAVCMGFLLAVPVQILGLMNDVVARMVEFYFIFSIILIPNVLMEYKNKKLVLVGEIVLYVLLFACLIIVLNSSEIVPYVPFWNGISK